MTRGLTRPATYPHSSPMSFPRALRILILALAGSGGAFAADTPASSGGAKASPFMPPAAAAQVAAAGDSGETLEFAGISSVGSRTDFIVYDRSSKKSFWIGMGETKNGIALVSHDPKRDILTLTSNGIQKQLPLRKVASGAGRPGVAPAVMVSQALTPLPPDTSVISPPPPPPALPAPGQDPTPALAETKPAPATPAQEAILKQETEARNLVSDLLEIGMAQRRAYEEAQRRNSGANPAEPPPESPKQP
jgi:hypothetical protein